MCALVACVPERSTEGKPRHFSTLCPSLDGLFLFYRNGIMRTCPQSNSFRCFCTVSVCQYVYYCLHRVAARQSSRRLASMQGARIKACGSFPPQIVLALTISKITRRCLALRRFAGTPKQNHPKISCSEDRFLSFRSGIFSRDNTDETRCNSFRRASAEIPCQYVYYCLRVFRVRSSENLLL